MMPKLAYTPLEKISIGRPVDRLAYIVEHCRDRAVLDLGCYDETALIKKDTKYWLHGHLVSVSRSVVGLDSSSAIPAKGVSTGPNGHIVRGDVTNRDDLISVGQDIDMVVAGELIEHLPDTLSFFQTIRENFRGGQLIATTPNATSITNGLLAMSGRESSHPDHVQLYSYKTLSTLCTRSGFEDWTILPYYVRYSEIGLRSRGVKRFIVHGAERIVNLAEWMCPLLAGGIILHVNRI